MHILRVQALNLAWPHVKPGGQLTTLQHQSAATQLLQPLGNEGLEGRPAASPDCVPPGIQVNAPTLLSDWMSCCWAPALTGLPTGAKHFSLWQWSAWKQLLPSRGPFKGQVVGLSNSNVSNLPTAHSEARSPTQLREYPKEGWRMPHSHGEKLQQSPSMCQASQERNPLSLLGEGNLPQCEFIGYLGFRCHHRPVSATSIHVANGNHSHDQSSRFGVLVMCQALGFSCPRTVCPDGRNT